MIAHKQKKKTKLRQKILSAFSLVLFFSLFWTTVFFNIVIHVFGLGDGYTTVAEQVITGRAGAILFVLVTVMFFLAEFVSYFVANSITRPIEKLGDFALEMSKGKFEPNDFEFTDIEVDNLNQALNQSARQLAHYDKTQKDFFQNASHELRTPVMSIKIYAEGITYGIMDPKTAATTILEETDRLSELVTDLLYIAKIDNTIATYEAEETDLIELIKNCAKHHQALSEKNNIEIILGFNERSVMYQCVPELVSRAVDNLVSNALRYAKTQVKLICHKSEKDIKILVQDDGAGIDKEALPHVFDRFYKGRGGNTGIGLAIVKSIAEQHKGYASAENRDTGNGAMFTISLPIL